MQRPSTLFSVSRTHDDLGLDCVRIFLGIALVVRGAIFMTDQSRVIALVQQQDMDWLVPIMLIHYVTLSHVIGGLMLAAGLFTRIAALVQLPVLVGAALIAVRGGLLAPGQSLELSVLVLLLLLIFAAFGSGKLSLDEFLLVRGVGIEEGEWASEADRSERVRRHIERLKEQLAAIETPERTVAAGSAEARQAAAAAARARLVLLVKYAAVGVVGVALLALALLSLPPAVSLGEVAAIAGIALLITGVFMMFYRSAFRD